MRPCLPWVMSARRGAGWECCGDSASELDHPAPLWTYFTRWPLRTRGLLVARRARFLTAGMGNRWNSSAAQPAIVQALGVDHTVESQLA
jgi:hypothetical protein